MRIGILMRCLASLILLTACNRSNNKSASDVPDNAVNPEAMNNPETASASGSVVSSLPVFQFETETYDFGSIEEGKSVSYAFVFKNAGESDLLISSAGGSCGCTVPDYPKEAIAPGKKGVINVTFNSNGKEGMQNKTVTVVANTIPNSKVLTITGEVTKK